MRKPFSVAVADGDRGNKQIESALCSKVTSRSNYDLPVKPDIPVPPIPYHRGGMAAALPEEAFLMLLYILGHAGKSAGLLFKDKSSAAEKGSIAQIVRKKTCVKLGHA